jgi:hypothetical protein
MKKSFQKTPSGSAAPTPLRLNQCLALIVCGVDYGGIKSPLLPTLSVISVRVTLDNRLRRIASLPTSMNFTSPLETEVVLGYSQAMRIQTAQGGWDLPAPPSGPAASFVLGLTPPATGSHLGRIWSGETKFADSFPSPFASGSTAPLPH